MLDQISSIYEDMKLMMRKLKKKSYADNTEVFKKNYGHYIDEIISYVGESEDKQAAIDTITTKYCNDVMDAYKGKRGKIQIGTMIDLNLYTIYYVFPAILMTNDENATAICDGLKDKWNETFKQTMDYTNYDTLYNSFNEKIFGIF